VTLDGHDVLGITSLLDPRTRVAGLAHRLALNADKSFIGSLLNGIGFVLSPEEAEGLIGRNSSSADVLFPYLTGDDLNSSPTQDPSRWVINFRDWTLEEASRYPDCLTIVEQRVKPARDKLPDAKRRVRENWWRFEHIAPALYSAINQLPRVIAIARVSRTGVPVFVRTGIVFSEQTVIFAYDDLDHLGLLTSAFHWWWAVSRASTMRTDLRYNPTDCFETFPQPQLTEDIREVARALDGCRRTLMLERKEGLTKTYNRVNDAADRASQVQELRRLHIELDHAVAAAYGWDDLDLDHAFHATSQGVRYTIDQVARAEVLDRLLELNHERYAVEVAAGLHGKKRGAKRKRNRVAIGDQTTLDEMS
jgi:hypothetical protein